MMGYEISGFQKEEPVPEQEATETPQQPRKHRNRNQSSRTTS